MAMDNPLEQPTARAIWNDFCHELMEVGNAFFDQSAPNDELTQAEGLRYLSRLLRNGLEFKLEGAQPEWPQLLSYAHETVKMGADNPDIRYLNCRVSPEYDYAIVGTRGSVHQLNLSSHAGGYGEDGKLQLCGNLADEDLVVERDGTLRILVSQTPQQQNWLPLTSETSLLVIRQIFLNRASEREASLRIERLNGGDTSPHHLCYRDVTDGFSETCASMQGTASVFTRWAQQLRAQPNRLPLADQAFCQSLGGDPQITYYHGYWTLDSDDSMVISLPRIPECRNWNLQINNFWMESLDYRFHRIHLNKHSAQRAADGSVRMVLAHRDPGVPNWLHTTGHNSGTMCFRWVGASEIVQPEIAVVPLVSLQPAGAPDGR